MTYKSTDSNNDNRLTDRQIAGFPVGTINHRNIDLLISAIEQGKDVYILRSREEASMLYCALADKLTYCNGKQSIVDLLQTHAAIQ